jgi:hypothetical protein
LPLLPFVRRAILSSLPRASRLSHPYLGLTSPLALLSLLSCIMCPFSNMAYFHPEDGDSRYLGSCKMLVNSYQSTHLYNPKDHVQIMLFYVLIFGCH